MTKKSYIKTNKAIPNNMCEAKDCKAGYIDNGVCDVCKRKYKTL